MELNQVPLWLVTSFVGAGIALLFNLWGARYRKQKERISSKALTILSHIEEYGKLAQYYRFMANVYTGLVENETGEFLKDEEGNFVVEKRVLFPEPRFEAVIQSLTGAGITSAITEKIAAIRLSSSEIIDLSLELDPSESIREGLQDLYISTVIGIEPVLKHKDYGDPDMKFNELMSSLKAADESRRKLRAQVNQYID